jgi:hypothetical protein
MTQDRPRHGVGSQDASEAACESPRGSKADCAPNSRPVIAALIR